jgi:hypothetical protein
MGKEKIMFIAQTTLDTSTALKTFIGLVSFDYGGCKEMQATGESLFADSSINDIPFELQLWQKGNEAQLSISTTDDSAAKLTKYASSTIVWDVKEVDDKDEN